MRLIILNEDKTMTILESDIDSAVEMLQRKPDSVKKTLKFGSDKKEQSFMKHTFDKVTGRSVLVIDKMDKKEFLEYVLGSDFVIEVWKYSVFKKVSMFRVEETIKYKLIATTSDSPNYKIGSELVFKDKITNKELFTGEMVDYVSSKDFSEIQGKYGKLNISYSYLRMC